MSVNLRKIILYSLLSQFAAVTLSGCLPGQLQEGGTTIDGVPNDSLPPPGSNPATGTVCNPFGGGTAGRDQGLKGELYYLPPELPHYQNVSDYITHGTKVDATLYFDQINVPTRPFDRGFVTTGGETLQTPTGDTLYEWFGIRFQSKIRLTNQDVVGRYQFALIADDGAVMEIQNADGSSQVIVNDDGQHATKLKVSRTPVYIGANDELPIEVRYYQGPRYHIAAMLLWREWPEGSTNPEPLDGLTDNYSFFNPDWTPSLPQDNYRALQSRGWRPVPAANFYLPSEVPPNPCTNTNTNTATGTDTGTGSNTSTATDTGTGSGTATSTGTNTGSSTATSTGTGTSTATDTATENTAWVIAGFDGTTTASSANLIWTTDGMATTSKVYYGLSVDALNQSVSLGAATAQTHSVVVNGLSPGTAYYFVAESIDAHGRIVKSDAIRKATK